MALTKVTLTGAVDNIKEGFTKVNDIIDDLASAANGLGASTIGVEDTAGNMAATDVEAALAEIYTDVTNARSLTDVLDEDSATTTGTTWGWKAGAIRVDNTVTTVAASTISLTDDSENYVEINTSGTVQVNTTSFTSGKIPIRQITVASGTQTVSTDKRAFFATWPDATATVTGVVELATNAETILGTDTTRVVTPAGLMSEQAIAHLPPRPRFIYTESLAYTSGGTHEILVGDTLTGATGGATAVVEHLTLASGTWAGGDAAGNLFLRTITGTFQAETLNEGANTNVCSIAGASAKDSVVIFPFKTLHYGNSVNQVVYSNAKIGFIFQNLGTSDWSYLYLDDSAIITAATNLITATQLVDAVTEPSQSFTKFGRYNGDDKCILGVLTDGSGDIVEFFHDGGDYVAYAAGQTDVTNQDVDVAWEDAESALTMPIFSTKAECLFRMGVETAAANVGSWRTNGQTSTTGKEYGTTVDGGSSTESVQTVYTDSGHLIELYHTANNAQTTSVTTHGWYFPSDM